MKILILADFGYVEGGAAKIALDSVKLLHKAGYEVVLFCGSERVDSSITDLGVRIVKLDQFELKSHPNKLRAMVDGLWNRKAERELRRLLSTLDPAETIVHIHSWTKILSPAIFSVLRNSRFRTIITAHDYFLGCPNGAVYDYQKKVLCPYKGGGLRCLFCNCDARNYFHKVWRWVRQRIVTYQLMRFKRLEIVTISNLSEKVLKQQIGTTFKCVRINNPIRFVVKDSTNDSSQERDSYVFIGRVSAEKDPETFAAAVTRCRVKGVVIGDGDLRMTLQKRYPDIDFLGWKDSLFVDKFLSSRTRALLFTSVWYEGAPLTPLEAMSNGVPCIISDRTAAAEYIEDGGVGLLFKCGCVDDLCDKIKEVSSPEFVKASFGKAFNRAKYSEDTYVERLSGLYANTGCDV